MAICEHVHVLHFDRLLNHKVEGDLKPNVESLFPNPQSHWNKQKGHVNRKVIGTNKMVIYEQQMYFPCLAYDSQIAVGAHWNKQNGHVNRKVSALELKSRMVIYEQQTYVCMYCIWTVKSQSGSALELKKQDGHV